MRITDPLNERQLAVLRWIAGGCEAGDMEGSSYKRTALALHDRGLVTVSRRGGQWSAVVTENGRDYVQQGTHPARRSQAQAPKRRLSPTEQLVDDVESAGGVLRVNGTRMYEYKLLQLIGFANRFGKAPDGKRLAFKHVPDECEPYVRWLEISFVDGPAGVRVTDAPVFVPDGPLDLHPLLTELADPASDLDLSPETVDRAIRILHVFLVEVEQVGCETAWNSHPGGAISIQRDGNLWKSA